MKQVGKFLLDTNTINYIVRAASGDDPAFQYVERHFRLHRDQCAIAATTKQELVAWMEGERISPSERAELIRILAHFEERMIPMGDAVSDRAGKLSAVLKRRFNKNLKTADTQIAATALVHRCILISHDQDFDSVPGLVRLDWYLMAISEKKLLRVLKLRVGYVGIAAFFTYSALALMTTSTIQQMLLALGVLVEMFTLTGYGLIQWKLAREDRS
ncbi:MAG: type II toxin-antitoxin system VapC family toxin [Anaerolineae bacterium]|nr:type II toxin-antitoxin system VapC family toxin [Anaerolineae bacterium]